MTTSQYKDKHSTVLILSEHTRQLQSSATLNSNLKNGGYISQPSTTQVQFRNQLNNLSIKFHQQYLFNGKKYDFYLPDYNLLIEVDGIAFHTNNMQNLTFMTISNKINDYEKNIIARNNNYKLVRIRYNKQQLNSANDIYKYQYYPDYSLL